ncbi:formylmethanofuran dehydrogenase subunit E family protein [Singulisphaera sp. PoT]|uniref:formylmethanofuran dehydrogenase subunit E family protein n=1 Tax=Singulisphaera sp. PoT TaxID=3411797 RepID=UPI003BF55F94
MRLTTLHLAALIVGLSAEGVHAHELWFQPAGVHAGVVRLTFADTPAPGEAERAAEIAHTRVWGDGQPLEVKRLPDGLEARLTSPRASVLSAYADRGIVDYMGDSFVIRLAAYSQSRPIKAGAVPGLGLDDDQVRLLLVTDDSGRAAIRATWRGKPAVGATLQIFEGGPPREVRTDDRGQIDCPDVTKHPVSLLAALRDETPGKRDGKGYSHVRYKATLTVEADAGIAQVGPSTAERLARVKEIHGGAGPWAVVGYRIGERALKELGLSRHSLSLRVVHHCPPKVQYSCIADGLQASTGASPGKLNLKVEEATIQDLKTVVEDRKSQRSLTFVLLPEFAESIRDIPPDRFEAEARRVAEMPDASMFVVKESVSKAN